MVKGFRKISTEKYVIAGVITFLIFALGLTLGLVLENQRYDFVDEINQEQDVKYHSLQLQYQFLNTFSNYDNCPIIHATLKEAVRDLDESLSRVISQEEESDTPSQRRTINQRRYIIDNLRYWLLARESEEKCHLNIAPILYFYTEDCPSCPNQGTILTYFKKLFGEKVLVFPINLDLREHEPMVEIMIKQFNIKKYPTIVINNKKYEGVVKKEKLQEIICEVLDDPINCPK